MFATRLLAVGALMTGLAGAAQATVLYDNLSNANVAGLYEVSGLIDGPLAASFSSGYSTVLQNIKVSLDTDGGGSGSFIATLWQDDGTFDFSAATYITQIGTAFADPSGPIIVDFGPLSIPIAQNTRYWVGLAEAAPGDTQTSFSTWAFAGDATGTNVSDEGFFAQGGTYFNASGILEPDATGPMAFMMSVEAPEPGSLAVLGFSLVGLGLVRRRFGRA